ncbi:hypothetical protein RUM44_010739 [Polyplax serrata]|uniref:Uncharacterized protein n=1 Tax=Polyplax serrata TaxID=468196 RepID=A0ABR1AN17_POLSC
MAERAIDREAPSSTSSTQLAPRGVGEEDRARRLRLVTWNASGVKLIADKLRKTGSTLRASMEVVYTWSELDDDELQDVGIQWALGLDIYNIRTILKQLASAQTPLIVRTTFIEYNPIPGAKWSAIC